MSVDDFLAEVLGETPETPETPACPCSHPRDWHRHEPDGRHCIRACGCKRYRGVADGKNAAAEGMR
jgi:hypothetical protein